MRILAVTILTIVSMLFVSAYPEKIESHKGKVEGGYNFWLSEPTDTAPGPKPAIIFLHGASLCGTDMSKVKRYGPLDAIERGRTIDAYVIAPQNPGGSWKPSKIKKVMDWVSSNYDVDSTRVYVIGMSLGGFGTIDYAAEYPDEVAAAIAICGGGTSKNLGSLNEVPLWIVHGTGDRAVPVSQSDRVVNAIKEVDAETPRLVYDRVPGMNHSQPARMFYLPEIYEWLFKHSLEDENRPVEEPTHITTAVLSRAYDGVKSKPRVGKKSTKKRPAKKSTKKRRSKRR